MISKPSLTRTLLITGILLISFQSCQKDENKEEEPTNTAPTASFTVTPAAGNTETIFSFNATASSDNEDDTTDLQFRWDWNNDGTWDTQYGNNPITNLQYSSEGDYTVKLEVKDSGGLTNTTTRQVTVEQNASFECGDTFVDPRDNMQYPTKEFDGKCWMIKNMNIGTMITGNENPSDNGVIEKYCYDDNTSNCDQYGALYQWNELMQYETSEEAQGICPDGWHVPSDTEWMFLEMAVGMSQTEVIKTGLRGTDEGAKLQSGGSSGFNALLGGYRNNGGDFNAINQYATFFTSSENTINLSWGRYLFNDNGQVLRDKFEKSFAYSVRCVKDE